MRPGRTAREERKIRTTQRAELVPLTHNSLPPEQKLVFFDSKFGKGLGATKERLRCQLQIERAKNESTTERKKPRT